ncbi:MAG: hypothetical protein QM690_18375 [Sphingobium sp.]
MFVGWKRERRIRKVLAGLARQRVAIVMQPGGVWVIENALQRDDGVEAALMTCLMRGWVEPLHEDMPMGDLAPNNLPSPPPPFTRTETIYRLTEGGWAALNRAHAWTLAGVLIAVLSLVATIAVAS